MNGEVRIDALGVFLRNFRRLRMSQRGYWFMVNGSGLMELGNYGRCFECVNVLIASFRSHSASVRKNKRACSPLILNAEFVNVLVC